MASEPQALAITHEAADEDDYGSLCAALEASARGRAFLAEYARRNRNADTELVLGALDQLAAQMRADAAAITDLRDELRMLLTAIRLARPDIDAGRPPGKVAMLTALVDLLERRIDAMVENKAAGRRRWRTRMTKPRGRSLPWCRRPRSRNCRSRRHLSRSRRPSPSCRMQHTVRRAASAAIMPEVNVLDGAPAAANVAAKPATGRRTNPPRRKSRRRPPTRCARSPPLWR